MKDMNKTELRELRKIIRKVVDETLWQREGKGCKHKKKKKWESKGGNLECQECGKKFRKANPTINTKCPKCGSHDLELSEVTSESAKRDYKDEYKKFQSSDKAKKYRAELNRYNREKGTYGNGDKKDASHKDGKIVGFEDQSKNRGRAEASRLKKK